MLEAKADKDRELEKDRIAVQNKDREIRKIRNGADRRYRGAS